MTEPNKATQSADVGDAAAKAGNIWTEIGPTLAFIIIYNVMLRFPEGDSDHCDLCGDRPEVAQEGTYSSFLARLVIPDWFVWNSRNIASVKTLPVHQADDHQPALCGRDLWWSGRWPEHLEDALSFRI